MVTFEVKWATKRLVIKTTQDEYDIMTVADLKLKCQEWTEIEPVFIKLLAHGVVLKDDAALLKQYKIMHGSKIMLMGSKNHVPPPTTQPKHDAPIAVKLLWLKNRRESVLKPDIRRYEKHVQEHLASEQRPPEKTKKLIMYGNYIHEQLIHMMQQLDTMPEVTDSERAERKSNVKDTETLLDLIDSIRQTLGQ
ncbi:hypothetical protein CU098_007651 [Rhizopus stolonifer]|uniref:Ubiquitin-like domain-containing protein n=1 Tax=Rhizopus stolonifer TaxID=4846 RepID=A0A367JYG6_RHIST|nr:hypothetical protein CU098_007651 [Rhizopus stolonifer]